MDDFNDTSTKDIQRAKARMLKKYGPKESDVVANITTERDDNMKLYRQWGDDPSCNLNPLKINQDMYLAKQCWEDCNRVLKERLKC